LLIFELEINPISVIPSLLGISYEVGKCLSEAKTIVLKFDFELDFFWNADEADLTDLR
jgi:hypothetical protein